MKSIWVIFRLMLLLVVAIRLLQSNKKDRKFARNNHTGQINLLKAPYISQKIPITKNINERLQIKELFRSYVRPMLQKDGDIFKLSIENRLILLVYVFIKQYEKGSLFHFLWYKNEWIIAFGQALHLLNLEKDYTDYKIIVEESCHFDISKEISSPLFSSDLYLFPDGNQEYDNIIAWEHEFSVDLLIQKTLTFVSKNEGLIHTE